VEGFQVQDSDTIAGKLQFFYCDQGIKVSNLGVSSYSPLLSYIQICHRLKNNDLLLERSKVNKIIHILSDNDIHDDNKYSNMLYPEVPCPIINTRTNLTPLQIISRYSYIAILFQRFRLTVQMLIKEDRNIGSDIFSEKFTNSDKCLQSNDRLKITSKFIKRINDLSISQGLDYYLAAIPSDSRKSKLTNYGCFQQIAELSGVKFIPAPDEFFNNPELYYFEQDIHLNSAGSNFFAINLFEKIYSPNN
tara:strand:+ start:1332 stop:2075 length:744 start_codon:yes stop_codon:yes gene_type:complete